MSTETATIGEVVAKYLDTYASKINDIDRRELSNLVRWFGFDTKVINEKGIYIFAENTVADYSESLSPAGIDYRERVDTVKKFLKYAENQGWVEKGKGVSGKVKIKKVKSVQARQREVKKVAMTREGYEAMQKELEELKTRRVKVIDDIRRAAADKDLKENAPYHAAREQKSQLDGRIMEIEETLKVADIVNEKPNDNLKINVGNTVKLKNLESGEEVEYTIVSPREVDPFEGRISNSSPVGKAVMGHSQGDTVEVTVPSGRKFHYRIEEVNH